jgi:hypothetical protein
MNSPALLLAELSPAMGDVIFTAVSVAFFALAAADAWFCQKIR